MATSYEASDIVVLTARDAIRKRPGMYLGGTDNQAVHHMLWGVVSNAVDEHLRGYGAHVRITLDRVRATVEDNGRGIPPAALDTVMTVVHGGSAQRPHIHLSPSLHGVGVAPICALSRELEATVLRDGRRHVQRFVRGLPRPIEDHGAISGSGTRITFIPDGTIFNDRTWNTESIERTCRELVAMIPTLAITLNGKTLRSTGLAEHVQRAYAPQFEPFAIRTKHNGIDIDLAIAFTARSDVRRVRAARFDPCAVRTGLDDIDLATLADGGVRGFVNCSWVPDGTHLDGLYAGLQAVLGARLGTHEFRKRIEKNLAGMIHVVLAHPRFGSPAMNWMQNEEVFDAVCDVVAREFAQHLDKCPALLDSILLALEPRHAVKSMRTLPHALRASAKSKASRTRES